jgi:drug/metabolite transporter (DMT)-like permease
MLKLRNAAHLEKFSRLSGNVRGSLVLTLAAFAFALMVVLIKITGQRLPVSQILFIRQVGMMLMLSPGLLSRPSNSFKTEHFPLHACRVVFALGGMTFGFTAVVNLPLAEATALGFAKSFFVTIFAVLILKETVGVYRWGAVAVGFIGVLIMLQPGALGSSIYGAMAIAGAACAGFVMVIIRLLARTESTQSILAYQAIGVGLVMAIPAWLYWVRPTPSEWLMLGGIGFVSYWAQKANIYAYRHGEASLLASLDYVRLVYATIFGWLIFQQLPGTLTLVGAGIIVMASLYTIRREHKRNQVLASGPDGRGFGNT